MRKKLMKLIDELPPHEGKTFEEALADHLIANGAFLLPCSYGKTIYAVGSGKIVECETDEISFGVCGLMYLVNFDCDSDCDGCPFNSWKQDHSGEWSCDGEYNQAAVKGCDFGKTVFLTREEAEAALAKIGGERQ